MNKITIYILTIILSISSLDVFSQQNPGCRNILVVFYNVENLFDTIDDPHKNDNEYLPQSSKQWNSHKYTAKLNNLSKVLSSISTKKLPDLIGLAEVENQNVVNDLSKTGKLSEASYQIVHYESPDSRGIDVALMVNPKTFTIIKSEPIQVSLENDNRFKTRDILYVTLYHKKSHDTIHVFVNHWPSRLGGEEKSRQKRAAAALTLKSKTDSLFNHVLNPKIIIIGDMNDEPFDFSLKNILNALPADSSTGTNKLYNLCYPVIKKGIGSYYYSGDKKWNIIDNMVVSGSIIYQKNGIYSLTNEINIFSPDWIMYTNNNGVKSPNRTYGKTYFGGYSDHLPIYLYYKYTKIHK